MTAIKKSTNKASKSPAPATKSADISKKSAAPAPTVTAPSPTKSTPVVTTITARIDVGFGNTVHVRGDGPGLNWELGVPMACISSDEWQLTLAETSRPIRFKLLVNDVTWSAGDDYVVAGGTKLTVVPAF